MKSAIYCLYLCLIRRGLFQEVSQNFLCEVPQSGLEGNVLGRGRGGTLYLREDGILFRDPLLGGEGRGE